MSICARIVVSVALQKIDNAPNAEACSKSDYKCLQNADCAVEKCHILSSLSAAFAAIKFLIFDFGYEKTAVVFTAAAPAQLSFLRRSNIQL